MNFFQKISLQRKQTLIILLTSGIALLLACLIFITYDVITFRRALVRNVSTLAEIVGNNTGAALDFDDPKSAEETLSALRAEPHIESGCIYNRSGEIFAVYDRADGKKEIFPPAAQRNSHYFQGHSLHLFRQIKDQGEVIGTVYVESDLGALYARLQRYALIVGGVFLLALSVALVLSSKLQKLISGPILHLVQTARSVASEKNYSMRAVKRSEDELGTLVDSFNEMLSEIQSRDAELLKSKDVLEQRVEERTRELAHSLSLIHATLESTADGILVAGGDGRVKNFNDHFLSMWKIPRDVADSGDEERMLEVAISQLKDPDQFLAKVRDLYGHSEIESFDELEFKDGRVFERYSKPQHVGEKYMGRVWSFRDITGRKRAEEVLRRTEELYRRAIAGADAVPYSYDFKTRTYLFMGEGIEQLTGYKIHEVTPQLWKTIIQESVMAGDTAGLTKEEAARRVATGEFRSWRCDMRIKTSDGKLCWLSDTSVQNLDESGHPVGATGILQDITERKQSEITALVFSKLSQNLSSAASPAEAARIIGEGSDELIGWDACSIQLYSEEDDTIYSIFETDTVEGDTVDGKKADDTSTDVRKATELHHRILNLGGELILRDAMMPPIPGAVVFGNKSRQSASILYVPIRCRDRRVGILSVHSYTFNAYDEQDLRILQTLADQCGGALERIRADEALRKSESQLRKIEELYRRAIAGADAVPYSYDYKTRAYVFMGKEIEQLIGYSADEVTPQLWKQIIQESVMAGETAGLAKDEAALRVKAGEIRNWRCDMRVITREGKSRWISDASVQTVDESGHAADSVGVLQDITERKQAEISAQAFSKLGKNLNSAASPEQAAEIISEVAGELLQRDACWIKLYNAPADTIYSVYAMDTAVGEGVQAEQREPQKPSELHRRIINSGAELILREKPDSFLPDTRAFGDKSRPSASLMFVPIRYGERVLGILSVQSYTPNAYDKQDLTTLQTLADQCGGAVERIWADEALRKSEAQLRQIEELYRRAIASADAVPYSYDYAKKSYVFMGQGIEQLVGYTSEEMSGEIWKKIVQESAMAGELAGLDKDEAARRVKSGEIRNWRCDMRVITREGKTRWISDASVQNLDQSGQSTAVGILQDITERKQSEISALAFSKLGQNLSSAANPETAARIIGEVANDLLGWDACHVQLYSAEEDKIHSILNVDLAGKKRVEYVPSAPRSLTELHRRILNTGAELILRKEADSFLAGGTPFGNCSRPSASLMFVPIRYRMKSVGILSIQSYTPNAYDEQSLRTLQTLADQCGGALERIRADEARRKSELQFRLVWDTSAEGMRLSNHDGIVVMVNDAYCRMVGKTKAEVEGKPLSLIHCIENQEFIQRKHREEIASKSFLPHLEKEVTLWNGKKIWFGLSNSMLELPGQPPLLLSVFRDITQRKESEAELDVLHHQLVDASRQAGMADVATNVLHNVGNVLNSVNVSGSLIRERIKKSKISNLSKIAELFQEQKDDLARFLADDPKGKQLPGYLAQLAAHLGNEREEILQETGLLVNNIEHIKEIVAMQQSYAKVSGLSESLQVVDLVEDALRMNAGALERHQVQVIREYAEAPPILVEKHKVLQILVNLIRNAKYACDEAQGADKHIKVRVVNEHDHLSVAVIDNGIGIPPENLTRIFNYGFTTRKDGHGFGLHSGALAAAEIGGSLNVHSDGHGKGAAFTLKLPINN